MGTVVLDASIVLGMLDPQDALHGPAATRVTECVRTGEQLLLPASALAEVLVGVARRDRAAVTQRRRALESLCGAPRVLDGDVAAAAAELRAAHRSLRLPDALVIATGVVDDADAVLTGDKRWSGIDPRVELIGP
jgi:predicted nucleic acid-binding protein